MATLVAPNGTDAAFSLERDERWQLAGRIAASPHFVKAAQLREILLYITKQALLEQAKSISEFEIAQAVLRRKPDFDPLDDSIVRVQISHVRKKLELYFANEGRMESLRLTIPRGSYVPAFETVALPVSEAEDPIRLTPAAAVEIPVARDPASFPWGWTVAAVPLVAVAVLTVLLVMAKHSPNDATAAAYRQNPILNRIFGGPNPVAIVVSDADFSMLEDNLQAEVSVHDYADQNSLRGRIASVENSDQRQLLQSIAGRRDTSLGEANTAFKLGKIASHFNDNASIRFARYLSPRDFEHGNFVLVGSRRGMPWVELFEQQLAFSYEKDPKQDAPYFQNKHPQTGEQAVYPAVTNKVSYTDVALVPNLGHDGYVLLIRGLGMESNETAADFLLNPDSNKYLTQATDVHKPIEVLLRTHIVEGTPNGYEVVAVR